MLTILSVIILFINLLVITRAHAAHATRGACGTPGRSDLRVRGPRSEARGTLSGLRDNSREACLPRANLRPPSRPPSAAIRETSSASTCRQRIETACVDERQTTASTSGRLAFAPAPRESARSSVLCSVASLRLTFAMRAGATAPRGRARATKPVERALLRSTRNKRAHKQTNGMDRQTHVPSQYTLSEHCDRVHDLLDFSYWIGFLFLH